MSTTLLTEVKLVKHKVIRPSIWASSLPISGNSPARSTKSIRTTDIRRGIKQQSQVASDLRTGRNIQNDLLHKFTTDLYRENDTVVIEDLDVKGMQMKKKAKNLHRSLAGVDSVNLWNTRLKSLVERSSLPDRFCPSTQRCSNCGHANWKAVKKSPLAEKR